MKMAVPARRADMSMGMMNTATTTGMSIATTKHTHTVETAVTAQKSITTAKTAPAGHAGTGTAIITPNTIITATRGITTRTRCSQAGEWNRPANSPRLRLHSA